MTQKYVLRPYQQESIQQVKSDEDDCIIVLPTGGGKSLIIKSISEYYAKEGKVIVVAVRTSILIPQLKLTLERDGLSVGVIKAGYKYKKNCQVILVMEQTFSSRYIKLDIKADILIRDEVHIGYTGKGFKKLKDIIKPERFIGLTATPITEKGYSLDKDIKLIEVVDTAGLMAKGYLSGIEYIIPRKSELMDYSGIATNLNDYTTSGLDLIINTPEHNKFVVDQILKHCRNRKIVVFANSIAHIEALSDVITSAGITNVFIHSKLPAKQAAYNLQQYKEGKVKCIVNMSILTTGFDDPATDCIVLVRPTKILRLFIQLVGRGLRLYPNKGKALLLDLAKCVSTHGFIEGKRNFGITDEKDLLNEQLGHQIDEIADMPSPHITKDKILEYRLDAKQHRIDDLLMKVELYEPELERLNQEITQLYSTNNSLTNQLKATPTAPIKYTQPAEAIKDFILEDIIGEGMFDNDVSRKAAEGLYALMLKSNSPYILKSCRTRAAALNNEGKPFNALIDFVKWLLQKENQQAKQA